MRTIIIHQPIWATRSVGIADYKVTDDLEIKIDYKDKDGVLLYPEPRYISQKKAKGYPVMSVKGIVLRIIPIDKLELPKFKFGKELDGVHN